MFLAKFDNLGLGPQTSVVPPTALIVVILVALLIFLYRQAYATNIPKIAGIPEVPGSLPFIGHLKYIGGRPDVHDCTVYSRWAKQLGSNIFQIKLGYERAVVVEDFQTVKDIWLGHTNDIIDRPYQHGFIEKLGVDLTGSSMTEEIRRTRKAAMRALGKPMWASYYHLLEPSSVGLVKELCSVGGNGKIAFDCYPYLRQVVFDLALSLTYGARMTTANDEFVMGLIKAINKISHFRASTERYRDYVPLLRWLTPFDTGNEVVKAEQVRARYLDVLHASFKKRIASGEDVPCVLGHLGEEKLTEEEIRGCCVSLLQAAPDSTASGIYVAIAWLASIGKDHQQKIYDAVMEAYQNDRQKAWDMAFREEKVPLVTSLYKEALRFWTFTPYATPRAVRKTFTYKGATIPQGTTMIMNAQAANHDTNWYGTDAMTFNPERFIGNETSLPHLTFGAGSRVCPAVAISNRIIYALLIRVVLAFKLEEQDGPHIRQPSTGWLDFSDVHVGLVALPKAYDIAFVPRDENWLQNLTA